MREKRSRVKASFRVGWNARLNAPSVARALPMQAVQDTRARHGDFPRRIAIPAPLNHESLFVNGDVALERCRGIATVFREFRTRF